METHHYCDMHWVQNQKCPRCELAVTQRLTGACIAMARIMAFAWMDATARDGRPPHVQPPTQNERHRALSSAISRGLFRLEFAR